MARQIKPDDLIIHFLNVGLGDNIIIEFPVDNAGNRRYGLVDCRDGNKTIKYLNKLMPNTADRKRLLFICATHPHSDHISGISTVINSRYYHPHEFWDSGFCHNSQTYGKILEDIVKNEIRMVRVSSGMEWYFGRVRFTALSPSVRLRNKYATYGVDMNNASIVLRIEHSEEDFVMMQSKKYREEKSYQDERRAGRSVVTLCGDAEFDSWAYICEEYPQVVRNSKHKPLVKKMINHLSSAVVKVAHHGSMHSTPLDVYEKMHPSIAIISTDQRESTKKVTRVGVKEITRALFPHQSATIALEECNVRVLTTDGSYEREAVNGKKKDARNINPGSIVIVVPPGGKIRWKKLRDTVKTTPDPPLSV
jgi:beta-lactamase superfamily II metal-dependent hydrolase